MSTVIEEAIAELSKLPQEEQDRIGRWLLDELAAEQRWNEKFEASHDALSKLANEVRADVAAGDDKELDPNDL